MFGLEKLFGRGKPPPPDGAATEAQFVQPVNLDEAHSFIVPGASEYPSPPVYGTNPFAARPGAALPAIAGQDAIMLHHLAPPPDRAPAAFYADRNADFLQRARYNEHLQPLPWTERAESQPLAVQPWDHTPPSPRPTSTQSPSVYRFIRPFDQMWERRLSGDSGSMAQVGRAYPVGGMTPMPSWRNTVRIPPPSRDTEIMDLPGATTAAVQPAVYVSPQAPIGNERWRL